jgi:multidrug resistance efflux pump
MTRSRARIAAPLAILIGGGVFAFVMYGRGGTAAITFGSSAYAELVEHPAAPLAAGRVTRVAVRMGQHVKPGDVLVVMDSARLALEASTARLALARANAELMSQEVVAGAAVARAELLVLRLQSTQMRDRAQLAEVEQQRARLEKLAEEKLVQARDVEEQRLKEADLAASLQVLDAATKQGQAGLGRTTSRKAAAADLEKRLEPLREAVRIREEAVKLADLAVSEATVRSHVEGTVSLVLHHEGDVVPAGTELVRIATGRPGRLVSWIPERQAQAIEAGREVHLREMRLFGAVFGGRVAEIAPEVEEVPVRARTSPQVPGWGRRIEIESWPPRPLVLGEAVRVRF